MATADSTLNVQVVTTTDLGGLNDFRSELDNVNKTVTNFNNAVKQSGAEAARGFELSRTEMARLTQEIIRGELSARGLAATLAEMGDPVVAVGLAIFTVVKLIMDAQAEAKKLNEAWSASERQLEGIKNQLNAMAAAATAQSDLANIAKTMAAEMKTATDKTAELAEKARDVSGIAREWHEIFQRTVTVQNGMIQVSKDQGTEQDKLLKQAQDYEAQLRKDQVAAMQNAQANVDWARSIQPTADNIKDLQRQYDDLAIKAEVAARAGKLEEWEKIQEAMRNLAVVIALVTGEYNKLAEAAKKFQEEQAKITKEAEKKAQNEQQKELNALLTQGKEELQQIRLQQELIKGAPFMGADEKQAALIRSYADEMARIATLIDQINAKKAGITDPAEIERLTAETQRLRGEWLKLDEQQAAAMHPLQAQLQTWVNSWGTATQQIGKMIENTITKALDEVNTYITTGKFNLQSFMQAIEQMGLKLVEQLLLQQLMARVNAEANAAQAAISGPQIAAAYSGAATTVTIATQGEAALAAPEEFAAALFSIQSLALAHEGGPIDVRMRRFHDGGLAHDEVPIIAQAGEFVVQKSVAQQHGEFLSALNAGMLHAGGVIQSFQRGGTVLIDPATGAMYSPSLFGGDIIGGDGAIGSSGLGGPASLDITGGAGVAEGNGSVSGGADFGIEVSGYGISSGGGPPPAATGGYGTGFDPSGGGVTGETLGTGGGGYLGSAMGTHKMQHRGGEVFQFHESFARGGTVRFRRLRGLRISGAGASGSGGGAPFGSFYGATIGTGGGSMFHEMQHGGGAIRRFHDGGGVSGLSRALGGVHIYAFTDLQALIKHMGSTAGQKIIFDTVRGRSIDLGIGGGG